MRRRGICRPRDNNDDKSTSILSDAMINEFLHAKPRGPVRSTIGTTRLGANRPICQPLTTVASFRTSYTQGHGARLMAGLPYLMYCTVLRKRHMYEYAVHFGLHARRFVKVPYSFDAVSAAIASNRGPTTLR